MTPLSVTPERAERLRAAVPERTAMARRLPALALAQRIQPRPFTQALGALMALAFFALSAQQAAARPAPESFADLAEQLLPTVVNVSSTSVSNTTVAPEFDFFRDFFERRGPTPENSPFQRKRERRATSLGSGFIIDAAGLIVTNNHVIEDATEVTVTLHDDTEFQAEIVGRDPRTDLALLRIDPKGYPLKATTWGDSGALRVGDWMMAIGNPFGLGNTVTAGIVSAKSRNINSGPYDSFIQTDASINRGNSGGPSFNLDGEVIGVNTAIFSPSGGSVGVGFAIPSDLARSIISQLADDGRVRRGWLGVRFGPVDKATASAVGLSDTRGAVVNSVVPDSPAEMAGIEPGDVILTWGDIDISEHRSLPLAVAQTPVGGSVAVKLWRDRQEQVVTVTVGELDEEVVAANMAQPEDNLDGNANRALSEYGVILSSLSLDQRRELGLKGDDSGVLVEDIDSSSSFARKGLRKGDVIAEVNDTPVNSPEEVLELFQKIEQDGFNIVTLRVFSEGRYSWMAVELN